MTSYGAGIERHQQIVASLSQFLNRHWRRALHQTTFVVFQNSSKNGCRNTISYFKLSPIVRMSKIQRRTKHTTQHCVRMSRENSWIYYESGVVYDKGDSFFASQNVRTTLWLCRILVGRLQRRAWPKINEFNWGWYFSKKCFL